MTVSSEVLVVANQTVGAPAVRSALLQRQARGPIRATLLVPAVWSAREAAQARLAAALGALERAGVPASGRLGDGDPIVAVQEIWDPGSFDEIIVATLAQGSSRWLQVGLPQRVARLTDCPVHHVEVQPMAPRVATPRRAPVRPDPLASVLSFLRTRPPQARGR